MLKNIIILKGIAYLLLWVMLYMHVCSAWCAIVPDMGCCHGGKQAQEKSCCSHHQDSNSQNKGCQDYHLSFFKASGQFASEKSVDVVKVFPLIPAEYPNIIFSIPVDHSGDLVAFNNYHPPPPITDIRIYIRSFQI